MDRYQESFATDSPPFVEARNEYPITQESVKFNTAASGSCCFTAAGTSTFTVPEGVYNFDIAVVGAGAGGVKARLFNCNCTTCYCGKTTYHFGGSGTTVLNKISSTPGAEFCVIVGAGGQQTYCPTAGYYCCIASACGGSSSFYNSDMCIKAGGGLGVCWNVGLAAMCTYRNVMNRLSGQSWDSSFGGQIQKARNSFYALEISSGSCLVLSNLKTNANTTLSNLGFYGAHPSPSYLGESGDECYCSSDGCYYTYLLPTLGTGGMMLNSGNGTCEQCTCAKGADGAIIITWLKGQ